jgi:hypothetical protein
MPDGLARGFARYGDFDHAQPVIITYSLEAFFKIAQTGYAVYWCYCLPYAANIKQNSSRLILNKYSSLLISYHRQAISSFIYLSELSICTLSHLKAGAKHGG